MFLHDMKVIIIQHGLAVFRQAMTIQLFAESKGRRYTAGDYEPLAQHCGDRAPGDRLPPAAQHPPIHVALGHRRMSLGPGL